MPSGLLRSSGSSGSLRSQWLVGNEKNSVAGKLGDKLLGVCLGLFGIDVKLLADPVADNFPQRSVTVGSLKDGGCDFVQREERRIGRVHDHHCAGQRTGGNSRTARNINASFRHAEAPPASCMRSCARNFALGPTPWHQDKTSGGEWEPWRRNRMPCRGAFPPVPGLRRRTEYCASGGGRLPRATTHLRGFLDPSPEKKERRPALCSSHRPWPALPRKEYPMPS